MIVPNKLYVIENNVIFLQIVKCYDVFVNNAVHKYIF